MLAMTAALVLVGVALTVFAGPLFEFSDQVAAQMLDREQLHRSRPRHREGHTR